MIQQFDKVSPSVVKEFHSQGKGAKGQFNNTLHLDEGVVCRGCGNAAYLATNLYTGTCPKCKERGFTVNVRSAYE